MPHDSMDGSWARCARRKALLFLAITVWNYGRHYTVLHWNQVTYNEDQARSPGKDRGAAFSQRQLTLAHRLPFVALRQINRRRS
jgi:hypothetical protein